MTSLENVILPIFPEQAGDNIQCLSNSSRNEKFLELLQNNVNVISSGSYNTVIEIPETPYLLRIMHWNKEYGPAANPNSMYYIITNMELKGLKVQSDFYKNCQENCQDYTCEVCEYGKFKLKQQVVVGNKKYIKKGVYAIIKYCGVSLDEYRNDKLYPKWRNTMKQPNFKGKELNVVKLIKENKIISKCLNALKCLHNEPHEYIHRDIKIENIMIQEVPGRNPTEGDDHKAPSVQEIQCKLIDFGFAEIKDVDMNEGNAFRGTAMHFHPNSIDCLYNKNCKPITPNIDIWALGMTFVRLVFPDKVLNGVDLIKSGCNILKSKPNEGVKIHDYPICDYSSMPDLIQIIKYFKIIIEDKNDMVNSNEFIYLLYVIFYERCSNINTILKCNFLQTKKSAQRNAEEGEALQWVKSNDIIEPNDLILYNDSKIYTSSLYRQSLILKKKSKYLKQWRERSVKFTIKNEAPYLLFYKGQKKTFEFNLTNCTVNKGVEKPDDLYEFSISNPSATNTLHLRVGSANYEAWKNFIENFIKREIDLYNKKNPKEKINNPVSLSDCSFIKTCFHEDDYNTSYLGGGRKKTKKRINKRYLKKTRRRKHKKRKRKTMYKKKLYTRKR